MHKLPAQIGAQMCTYEFLSCAMATIRRASCHDKLHGQYAGSCWKSLQREEEGCLQWGILLEVGAVHRILSQSQAVQCAQGVRPKIFGHVRLCWAAESSEILHNVCMLQV